MNRVLATVFCLFAIASVGCAHKGHKSCDGHSKDMHGHFDKKWEMMDTDKDGFLSKAEFDKTHQDKFTQMDSNKDGKVSKEEKMASMKDKHGHHHKGKKDGCCG